MEPTEMRQIEVFGAGCPVLKIRINWKAKSPASHANSSLDMHDAKIASGAKSLDVKSVPAVG